MSLNTAVINSAPLGALAPFNPQLGSIDPQAMAAQYARDRALVAEALQALMQQLQLGQAQIDALNNRVDAVTRSNVALEQQMTAMTQENQALQGQADSRQAQVQDLAQRVEVISGQNAALQSQVTQEQRQRQEAERAAAVARQERERAEQAQRDAVERAGLEVDLGKCEAALAALDTEATTAPVAVGALSGSMAVVVGAMFGGPIGAAAAGAIVSVTGTGMSAVTVAETQAADRARLTEDIQRIKARLLVLPRT
jgi:hypothetical protein